jgi:hypothetical protein
MDNDGCHDTLWYFVLLLLLGVLGFLALVTGLLLMMVSAR